MLNMQGCLAGEVENPAKTYVLGTLLTTLFVTLSYALPVFVSITTHPNFWEWDQGSLARYTADVAPWLGVACTILSLLCQLGIFTTGLSTNTRAVSTHASLACTVSSVPSAVMLRLQSALAS